MISIPIKNFADIKELPFCIIPNRILTPANVSSLASKNFQKIIEQKI